MTYNCQGIPPPDIYIFLMLLGVLLSLTQFLMMKIIFFHCNHKLHLKDLCQGTGENYYKLKKSSPPAGFEPRSAA